MIDFERAQIRAVNDEAARRFMLAKIDRELAGAPVGDRMRFLCAYCGGARAQARGWWRRVEEFSPKLARRDFARLARKATRAGRRFRRLAHGAWRGYAQVGTDEARLLDALPEAPPLEGSVCVDAIDGLWRVRYGGVRQSEGRRIWVTANFLWARGGLCPRPLAAWRRSDQTVLLLERRPGAQSFEQCPDHRRALAAVHILLDRVLALTEIRQPPSPETLVIDEREGSALRASLLAPDAVFLQKKPCRDRRQRVSELVHTLRESPTGI